MQPQWTNTQVSTAPRIDARHQDLLSVSVASPCALPTFLSPGLQVGSKPNKVAAHHRGLAPPMQTRLPASQADRRAQTLSTKPERQGNRVSPSASSGAPVSTEAESASKGAISQLQEFVQGAKVFPMPPNCPVLQWSYDTRMVGTSLEFRATGAFLLDGVAHHTVGVWRPSKKLAQRDCAERALGLFVHRWASMIALDEFSGNLTANATLLSSPPSLSDAHSQVERLEIFCKRLSLGEPVPINWSHRWESEQCQAYAEIRLMDVPHTFPGRPMQTQQEAYEDTAHRVLWYLQCPGSENDFEPDSSYVKVAAQDIPEPHSCWVKDEGECEGEEQQLAERKTTIMRVQNRLQQAYARQLEAGISVWFWSYERDPKDKGWPPMFRATVNVPLANRTFSGSWQRGQREAQIQTCAHISKFLDEEFPNRRT
jgi:hypothetical protein